MSAISQQPVEYDGRADQPAEQPLPGEPAAAPGPVVVRRRAGVAAGIGVAASTVAIAYLWRASQSLAVLDWALFAVMAVVAAGYLAALVDSRTPLLVADDLGIRLRIGHEWRGLPWEAIGHVVVHPRRGLLRDGRLVVVPDSLARAVDGLDGKGRRHVLLNQKMYGAPLAVPLGLTTRIPGRPEGVTAAVATLARDRAAVVELDPHTLEPTPSSTPASTHEPTASDRAPEPPASSGSTGPAPAERTPEAPASAARAVFPRVHADDPARTAARPAPPVAGEPELEPVTATALEPDTASAPASEPATASEVGPAAGPDQATGDSLASSAPMAEAPPRRTLLGGLATVVSRATKRRTAAGATAPAPAAPSGSSAPHESEIPSVATCRTPRPGTRTEATLGSPAPGVGVSAEAAGQQPEQRPTEGRELRRPGSVDLVIESVPGDRVRPISSLGVAVDPLVIDDFATEPAYDPVIGPELTAARTRLGLSVDELAERTRIRAHVIESIEVDDFAPCGGDFYARGHLRTLARILGKDPAPLLATFEERYATAPVNARRVFEAELATGMTGSMRATSGGPSWGLLVGLVLVLALVWGLLRLVTGTPEPTGLPAPVIEGAALLTRLPGLLG